MHTIVQDHSEMLPQGAKTNTAFENSRCEGNSQWVWVEIGKISMKRHNGFQDSEFTVSRPKAFRQRKRICQSDVWLVCMEQKRQKPGKCPWGQGTDVRFSKLSRNHVSKKRKERKGTGKWDGKEKEIKRKTASKLDSRGKNRQSTENF